MRVEPFFRASVGAYVVDDAGRVLAVRRRGVAAELAWQMPQGGIDPEETPRQAVLRELEEETGLGLGDVEIVDEHPGWLVYELPPEHRRAWIGWGQAQKWFLLRARDGARVSPDGEELDAFEWTTPALLMPRVVPFRRPIYARVFAELVAPRGRGG